MEVTHKPSGKSIAVEVEKILSPSFSTLLFKTFGVDTSFQELKGEKCIVISDHHIRKDDVRQRICEFFGLPSLMPGRLCIRITNDSWNSYTELENDFLEEKRQVEEEWKVRTSQMHTWYEAERESVLSYRVALWRKNLPEEPRDKIIIKQWVFDGIEDSALIESRWNADFPELYIGRPREISEELAQKWIAIHAGLDDEKQRLREEKKRKQEAKEAELAMKRKEVEENELLITDADGFYAHAGGLMLHSIGASISKEKNELRVWRTLYADHLPGALSKNDMMADLSIMGYTYDPAEESWVKKASSSIEEDRDNLIEYLNTHDRKAWPEAAGFARCWECGTYHPKKSLRWDGNGLYCGC